MLFQRKSSWVSFFLTWLSSSSSQVRQNCCGTGNSDLHLGCSRLYHTLTKQKGLSTVLCNAEKPGPPGQLLCHHEACLLVGYSWKGNATAGASNSPATHIKSHNLVFGFRQTLCYSEARRCYGPTTCFGSTGCSVSPLWRGMLPAM